MSGVDSSVQPPVGAPLAPRRRRSKYVSSRKRSGRVFGGAIAGVILSLGIFGVVAWQRLQNSGPAPSADVISSSSVTPVETAAAALEKVAGGARPVFRYSVVPGGVRSAGELLEAMARDKVVADHYAGVDPSKMRTERLSEPMQAHVSYRIADRVYWTRKKVTVQAGEQVLTDGTTTVRGRCGNNISVDPLLPTLDNEPKPETFDAIVAPLSALNQAPLDPKLSFYTPPHLTSRGMSTPPGGRSFGNPPGGGPPPGSIPPGGNPPGGPPSGPPGEPPPSGVPPGGNPPGGNPPGGDPPGNPPGGNPPGGNPPGGDPPGGDPPGDPPGNPPGNPPGDPPGNPPGNPPPGFPPTPPDVPNPPTPVPEPGTLLLVAAGAGLLLARRIRKQAQ